MAEVASSSRYIQCVVDAETFKRLKIEAIHRDQNLGDLLRQVVEDYVDNLDKQGEEHG